MLLIHHPTMSSIGQLRSLFVFLLVCLPHTTHRALAPTYILDGPVHPALINLSSYLLDLLIFFSCRVRDGRGGGASLEKLFKGA